MVSIIHIKKRTHIHASVFRTHARPRGLKAKMEWCNTTLLSLCLSKRWHYMTGATRRDMFSTRGCHISYRAVLWVFRSRVVRVNALHWCIGASCTSPSLTAVQLRQHWPPNTPSHVRECVSGKRREMECVHITMKKGGRRRSPEKPEGGRKQREREERDRYVRRLRGQIWEKVEWDIWKRERVIGMRRKLQLPNNDSFGKIVFSPLSSSNLST